jgi:DNA-binding NarL/FixJ family response regulator
MHEVVHFQRADGTPVAASQCPLVTEGTEHPVVQTEDEAFTRKDGTVFPVAFSSMPLKVGTHVEGVSVVFRDLSDPRTPTNPIRVLIADADPVARGATTTMLTRHEGVVVVAGVSSASEAVGESVRLRPDVVLVDAALPPTGGSATTVRIRAEAPEASVVLMAVDYDEAVAAAAIAAGCVGVVDKQRAWVDLADAVRAAYHGGTAISQADLQRVVTKVRDTWQPGRGETLTDREREVLVCLTQGLTNKGAADRLGVTVNTIRNHVQRILYKLGVHSKLEAVVVATRDGLLDVAP